MKYHLHNRLFFTGQQAVIVQRGDDFFDLLTARIPLDARWTYKTAAQALQEEYGYKPRTAYSYAAALITNVRAESGDNVIERLNRRQYRWAPPAPAA